MAISSYVPEDLDSVVALLRSALPGEGFSRVNFARKILLSRNFDPRGAFVARDSAHMATGFLLAMAPMRPQEDAPPEAETGRIVLFAVAERARRIRIGTELLKKGEEWLRSMGRRVVLVAPCDADSFMPGVDTSAYPEAFVFLHGAGYHTACCPISMDLSLVDSWEPPDWLMPREQRLVAEGVTIVPFSAYWILPLTGLMRHEFPGEWQGVIREAMHAIVSGHRTAEDVLIAVERGRVVGFVHSHGDNFGPFGVAKSHRGRGIGSVLLFRMLEEMRTRGRHNTWFIWPDDNIASRIYKLAGFRETRRFAVLRKYL
jgi:GNAT superfamily N-acetyltransferase